MEMAELQEDSAVDEGFWDEVVWRDHADRVLDALDSIPMEFRMTVMLCDVEQLSYEDAARILEIPIGTVRSRLSRGRAMIRAIVLKERR
jgi:RNA polymerase sigma-70 factor (ECF subfamily)